MVELLLGSALLGLTLGMGITASIGDGARDLVIRAGLRAPLRRRDLLTQPGRNARKVTRH